LQARALGASVEAWSEDGRPLVGEVGELVITEPMPSIPLYLWGDEDGSRYRESYFSTFPGVWRHGDWIEITARGTAIITGRADAPINRGGARETGARSPRGGRRPSPAGPTRRSIAAACGWARASCTAACSRSTRSS